MDKKIASRGYISYNHPLNVKYLSSKIKIRHVSNNEDT